MYLYILPEKYIQCSQSIPISSISYNMPTHDLIKSGERIQQSSCNMGVDGFGKS